MIVTILGSLIGLAGTLLPQLLGLFTKHQDNKQELEIIKLQIEATKQQGAQQLEEVRVKTDSALDVAEQTALNDRAQVIGIKWIDALGATVRPVITYSFFIFYVCVKVAQFYSITHNTPLPWQDAKQLIDALIQLWSDEDKALFATIMVFWFGDRVLKRRGM